MPVTLDSASALAVSLFLVTTLAAPMTIAQQVVDLVGDPERGKSVYRSVGYCGNCHGWPGDGITGILLQAPRGSNLRETKLDREGLIEVVSCGIPGTSMPYHDRAAYRDDRCYEMVMSDLPSGSEVTRGKTFSDQNIANVVAYLQAHVIGLGEPTYAECADFFGNPAASACRSLK